MNRFQFTQDITQRIGDAGLFDGHHIELINGDLIDMPHQGPIHSTHTSSIANLMRIIYPNAYIREDKPIDINLNTMPEPDIAVINGTIPQYKDHHPKASEALLLIEVAVTSLIDDSDKAALYASGGAPYYWIIDVKNRCLIEYTTPAIDQKTYRNKFTYESSDSVELPSTNQRIAIEDLLP